MAEEEIGVGGVEDDDFGGGGGYILQRGQEVQEVVGEETVDVVDGPIVYGNAGDVGGGIGKG